MFLALIYIALKILLLLSNRPSCEILKHLATIPDEINLIWCKSWSMHQDTQWFICHCLKAPSSAQLKTGHMQLGRQHRAGWELLHSQPWRSVELRPCSQLVLERMERKTLPRPDDPELPGGRLVVLQTHRFLLAFSVSFTRLRMLGTHIYWEYFPITPYWSGEMLFCESKLILLRKKLEQVSYVRETCIATHISCQMGQIYFCF